MDDVSLDLSWNLLTVSFHLLIQITDYYTLDTSKQRECVMNEYIFLFCDTLGLTIIKDKTQEISKGLFLWWFCPYIVMNYSVVDYSEIRWLLFEPFIQPPD